MGAFDWVWWGSEAAPSLKSSRRRLAAGLFAAATLGACVATQQSSPDQISSEQVDEVFSAGYESIETRYVDKVMIGTVALEGMRGLSDLDAEMGVTGDGDKVALQRGGAVVATFPAPGENDAQAWAGLTVKMVNSARAVSPRVGATGIEQIYQAVFNRALTDLDEFSRYAGTNLARNHRAVRDGFGGIGFEFTLLPDRAIEVALVVSETPAERGGLKVGDVITEIDGTRVAGLDRDDITRLLRGRVSTRVTLTLRRTGAEGAVTLIFERALIVPPTVTARLESGIAFLTIASFNQKTAATVASAFDRLKAQGKVTGIVLDLRGNPGGLLDQAIAVADLFLDGGEIIATHGRHPDSNQRFDSSGNDIAKGLPMAVLINGDSASAAEIVAAALQDQGRAVLVGSNSYGKGTVQNVIHLPNDGELTLTWSRIEAPSGYAFHHLGLMPALCTSKPAVTVPGLVSDLRNGKSDQATVLAAWRAGRDGDHHAAEALRASCPPSHEAGDADVEVARDVIADSDLYARALKLSSPAVAASAANSTASIITR